jgi:hypothetical protein
MSSGEPPAGQLARWVGSWATIIAPATVLSTLLFYFGYVSARSQYQYFGVDVDTIGLSTQDYIMRSPQPLLVPLLVLTLLAAALLTLDAAISTRVTAVPNPAGAAATVRDAVLASRIRYLSGVSRVLVAAGLAGLGAGMALLLGYALVRDWAFYNLVTPLLFALGAGLLGYASRVSGLLRRVRGQRIAAEPDEQGPAEPGSDLAPPPRPDGAVWLRRVARTLIYIVLITGTFWATATIAQWSGRGLARDQARHIDSLPRVILDTKERLFLRAPGIEERVLPPSEGQTFHYRYRNLRLLIVGHERMFLVPEQWSAGNSTLVVPLDGSVRVQFQYQS